MRRSTLDWITLRAINHIQNPPKDHELEVVVYSKQEMGKDSGLPFHLFLNNCAACARDIRNTALQHGAWSNSLAKRKFTTIDSARKNIYEQIAKSIVNFAQTFQNINPENRNFTYLNQEGFYLLLQLLFDRTVSQVDL